MGNDENKAGGAKLFRIIFGIFMIIVYVGMGVLMLCNFFGFSGSWEWLRWVGGVLLIIYGLWRGYRQYAGMN